MGKEVGVDEDGVGWGERGVVLEEEGGGDLWAAVQLVYSFHTVFRGEVSLHLTNNIVALCLFLLLALLSLVLVLLQARITLTDDTLNGAELAGLLCDTHIVELRSISEYMSLFCEGSWVNLAVAMALMGCIFSNRYRRRRWQSGVVGRRLIRCG